MIRTREKRKGRAIAKLAEESLNLQVRRRILDGIVEKGKGIDFEEYDPWSSNGVCDGPRDRRRRLDRRPTTGMRSMTAASSMRTTMRISIFERFLQKPQLNEP